MTLIHLEFQHKTYTRKPAKTLLNTKKFNGQELLRHFKLKTDTEYTRKFSKHNNFKRTRTKYTKS